MNTNNPNDPAAKAAANKAVLENIVGGDPRLKPEAAKNLISDLHSRGIHDPAKVREIVEKTIRINPQIVAYSTGAGGSYPPKAQQPAPSEKKTFPPESYEEAVVLSNITGKPVTWQPKVFNDSGMIDGMTPAQRLAAANEALHGKNGRGRR